MGLMAKALSFLSGLALAGTPLWPLGLALVAYPVLTLAKGRRSMKSPPLRFLAGGLLLLLASVALAAGGRLSPLVLAGSGALTIFSPHLPPSLSSVVPVEGSVLLRSKLVPFRWHLVAEAKPAAEDYSRSLSHFTGRLLVRRDTRSAYVLSSCFAVDRESAEQRLLRGLDASAASTTASILPMDSADSSELLRARLTAAKGFRGEIVKGGGGLVYSMGVNKGRIITFSSFDLGPEADPTFPSGPAVTARGSPLLWELMESLSKSAPWPGPDSLSGFVESLRSTRGEPMGERIGELEGSGEKVLLKTLGGEKVEVARAQLRALATIYA